MGSSTPSENDRPEEALPEGTMLCPYCKLPLIPAVVAVPGEPYGLFQPRTAMDYNIELDYAPYEVLQYQMGIRYRNGWELVTAHALAHSPHPAINPSQSPGLLLVWRKLK